jgi:hypothetical protein
MKSPKPATDNRFKWVDYDVQNWFPTLQNFYRSPFWKWAPQYHTNSTLSDFNEISYVGRLWCPEMIPDIAKFLPVSIFKMGTTMPQKIKLRICHNAKCSFKRINSGHHNLHTYEISLKSKNVEFVWYCGGHFENGDR